ncbi:hypothetical protein TWF703_005697 [Orbilia oligospora]|uniref:F-box domain-containing protein n=1 Tax=Orbilia oligospora TaxID=2813651 RepID=A0A7C8JTT6_ORBOL|nr:hypothetical protein TWF703_005697 [Orbilia oligospora]
MNPTNIETNVPHVTISRKSHILSVPTEVAFLFFDRLEKKDLASLRLTCHQLNQFTVERLFKCLVIRPTQNLAGLNNLRDETAQYVQSIELFPARPSDLYKPVDESNYQSADGLKTPSFPNLRTLHLHGHNLQMRRVAVKLLREHNFVKDLALNFKQRYFMPKHCEEELQGVQRLETLSIRLGRTQETWARLPHLESLWDTESIAPAWDMITANSDTLKVLNLEFPSEIIGVFGQAEPSHSPDTSALFPTTPGKWRKQLQLRELKLQHLENFGQVYEQTKFFNPETLQSLSLVDCPESDGALLALAESMTNLKSLQIRHSLRDPQTLRSLLKRLPSLENLHIALPYQQNFDYKWLATQKHSVKYLWVEALDSRDKDNDNFEDWTNLEELAFMKFHQASGRRSGVLCLKNLRIPANLRMIRLLHPQRDARRDFDPAQVSKLIEALGVRQFRMMSAKYPRTTEGKRKRMYIKPNLKFLAIGSWHGCDDTHDQTRVLKLDFQHTERLGKFQGSFERIPMRGFARGHPDTRMLAYGEARGWRAWAGRPFTTEMTFGDDA